MQQIDSLMSIDVTKPKSIPLFLCEQQITIALDVMNNLLQTQAASSLFVSDEESLSGFIDMLLGVIKLYLAIEEVDNDDENYESTSEY